MSLLPPRIPCKGQTALGNVPKVVVLPHDPGMKTESSQSRTITTTESEELFWEFPSGVVTCYHLGIQGLSSHQDIEMVVFSFLFLV